MIDNETLRSAYALHNSQISQIRQKIHSITTSAIGVFLIVIGWSVSSTEGLHSQNSLLLSLCVVVVFAISEINIWSNSCAHVQVAKVVYKINKVLGLYNPEDTFEGESLYPEKWKRYENLTAWSIAWHHMIPVSLVGGLALVTLWV